MYSSIPDEDYNFTAGVDISTICWILWGGGGGRQGFGGRSDLKRGDGEGEVK